MNIARYEFDIRPRQRENALRPIMSIVAGDVVSNNAEVRLQIAFRSVDVNLRELSAYLALIDRCFGRLTSENGLATYSRRRDEQINARSIKAGSTIIELVELVSTPGGMALVAIWLVLKYAPSIIKSLPEGAKQLAEAYDAFEGGRLKKENRRQIRQQIQRDEKLQALDKSAQEKLIPLIERLLERESSLVNAAGRFADNSVLSLDMSVEEPSGKKQNATE